MKSPLSPAKIPERSLHEVLLECFESFGDRKALVDGLTDKTYTYKELNAAVHQVASGLYKLGVRHGDIVAFFSPNSLEYVILLIAVLACGAAVSTINPSYTAYELTHHLKSSKAPWIFTIPSLYSRVIDAAKNAELNLKTVIVPDSDTLAANHPNTVAFNLLLSDDGSQFPKVKINVREDVAIIPYSSGTTGLPKGVMLTHYNIMSMAAILGHEQVRDHLHGPDEQPIMVTFLPLYHAYGMISVVFFALGSGMMNILLPRFTPELILQNVEKYKATMITLVPPTLIQLTNFPDILKYDLSSIRRVVCGAAPLSREAELNFKRIIDLGDIRQGFGMTETTLAVTLNTPNIKMKSGSVGIVLPNTEVKVIDVSTGKTLGPNERGEVCAFGPQIMKGYLNNKKATDETIDSEGWLHTGDIGYYDEDGYFFIVDRMKELIKYKGFQVAPAELEALLLSHPGIADAAVIGVPDHDAGELPRAYVVVKPGVSLTVEEVKQFVADHVSNFKYLRGGVEFVKSIPKSETGKILRRVLRAQLSSTKSKL